MTWLISVFFPCDVLGSLIARCKRVSTVLILWRLSWWEEESKYLSVWVALRYTPIVIVLFLRETRVSRKAICCSDSSSIVNEMCGSMELSVV